MCKHSDVTVGHHLGFESREPGLRSRYTSDHWGMLARTKPWASGYSLPIGKLIKHKCRWDVPLSSRIGSVEGNWSYQPYQAERNDIDQLGSCSSLSEVPPPPLLPQVSLTYCLSTPYQSLLFELTVTTQPPLPLSIVRVCLLSRWCFICYLSIVLCGESRAR